MSPQAKEIPGIKIFRSSTTIYYTNAEMYLEALQEKVCVCVCACAITRRNPLSTVYITLNCFHYLSHFRLSRSHVDARLFVQSGIEIGKLLTQKKKRDAKLKRTQEKEKKKAKKEAKKQVRRPE